MKINGTVEKCAVFVSKIAADSPAKAALLNMVYFNGCYGCSYCETPGVITKKGRGHNRSYAQSLKGKARPRTAESMKRHGNKASIKTAVRYLYLLQRK